MSAAEGAQPAVRNHPLAPRMAAIAFLNFNVTLACIFGSFSVILSAIEARLGVGRELSTMAIPALTLANALLAAVVGALATRRSLRLVMLVGAALGVAGFLLLALTASYPLYIAAFGLLLGPAMAAAAVLSPTLVTRWYVVNGGRMLGLVTMPILIALMPLVVTWMLQGHGLTAAYLMLAGFATVILAANFFIVDRPPGAQASGQPAAAGAHGPAAPAGEGGMTTPQLLRSPAFWMIAVAFMASAATSIALTTHMVPMAGTWGFSATLAATLVSIQALAGIPGTLIFGWIADRLGGARALFLVVFDAALLVLLLLLELPFPVKAAIIALIGVHGAAALPVVPIALSERFGRENFSRAYGLMNLVNLPVSVICVPAASLVYTRTGSYAGAIVGVAAFLLLAAALVFVGAAKRRKVVAQPAQ
jgi:cyanate permease